MQQPLSPKKYIETKARSLPLYKCLVNKGWEQSGLASVTVMRQHVNSNVTGADFLVDLKCLGVKDSHWFFNEPEAEMMEKFNAGNMAEEIDYTMAHNIIYAGYEFALDFDIQPDKNFAVSKYILEEDDDRIPLIDIETGEEGIPHLIEFQPGQYSDALLKLKKNAGEGNYRYTTNIDNREDELKAFDEDGEEAGEEDEPISLTDIPVGELDLQNVQQVSLFDLVKPELVDKRNRLERVICEMELSVRLFEMNDAYNAHNDFIEDEWDELPNDETLQATGADPDDYEVALNESGKLREEILYNQNDETPEYLASFERYLAPNNNNPVFIAFALEFTLSQPHPLTRALLNEYLQPFENMPVIQLLLALESLLQNRDTAKWSSLIESRNIADALPGITAPGNIEYLYFWVLQAIRNARLGNASLALGYYRLVGELSDVLMHTDIFILMVLEILPRLQTELDQRLPVKH